ncbi:hypothetical protein JN531_010260 [Flagellatimonas centrodinii]|uniref:hypothetical protein n=1 Tax=Flagellatimonas centrodinii TaxID=2806210 RepID=UPI001FF00EF8|nr:hypothetical protein [Flagellatimonas centrodinii]ULQ45504.1 hypothetical protein JN531_010260 [Flagellatimonas centrodinii]
MIRTVAHACGALLLASTLAAQAETVRFYGYAFDLETDAYLYTEVHEQEIVDGQWRGGRIRYFDPAGELIGDKPLDFSQSPYIPVYRLDLPYKQYAEGISAVDDEVTLFKEVDGTREEERVDARPMMAADSGFHSLLRDNFDTLMAGKTAKFRLLVAGNLDAYSFRARKVGDITFDGAPAVQLVVEPDSLLRLLVDRLELVYEPTQRRLLEYRGISNIHDPATDKPYNARIVYPSKPPAGAPETLPPLQ